MGFLEDLGSGLQRGALAGAGALSRDVYGEQARQREARATQGRAQQLAVAQHILQAVHNGQVDDANLPELQQQLSRMGYNIPMQAFGPSIEAKHSLAKYANEISRQKRADDAAKQLLDYKFGGQQGLAPDNVTGLGLASQPGLSQLDAMMPKGDLGDYPQSSLGMDFTPDNFDQAPPKPQGSPPPIVQTPTGAGPPTGAVNPARGPGPTGVQSFAYDPRAQTGPGLDTGEGQAANMPQIPAEISPTGVKSFAYNPSAQTGQGLETQTELPQSADGTYQLSPMEVTGKLPQRASVPQQSVAPPALQRTHAAPNIQAGTSDLDELYRRALYAMQNGVPGGKEMLDYVIKMREGPKTKNHVIDGSLISDSGNVIYKGSPDQIKAVQEFNAFLDQSGITDPSVRQQKWAKYVDRKGEGIQVNNYPNPIAVTKPDGTQGMVQFGNKGETRETSYLPPEKDKVQKALPNPAVEKLSAAGQALENTNRQVSTFKDEYGGHKLTGDLSNTAGRILGDDSGQAQWWQDFEASSNQTRHALFGSALTQTELAAWTKTTITPRMNPDEIRKNLTRRKAIEISAAQKLARGYTALGYSPDAIAEFIGPDAASFVDAPREPSRKAMTIKSGKDAGEYYQEGGKWYKK